MTCVRSPVSLRQVEDLLFERSGVPFAAEIRKRRGHHHWYSNWCRHLVDVFGRINVETHYLWRTVDHEGEMLEFIATKRRDRRAAPRFLKRAMKRYGRPTSIVTDRLRSYRAAMNVTGHAAARICGRWLNNRLENSHPPFRRREATMVKFRDVKIQQKFAAKKRDSYIFAFWMCGAT